MRYVVVIDEGPTSFGAYVPAVPGCIAVGESRAEVLQLIEEAVEFHLEGIREQGHQLPQPRSSIEFIEVHA